MADKSDLLEILQNISDRVAAEKEIAEQVLEINISTYKRLYNSYIEFEAQKKANKLKNETEINDQLIKMGYGQLVQIDTIERERAKREKEAELRRAGASESAIRTALKDIDKEYDKKLASEKDFLDTKTKLQKAQAKKAAKDAKKIAQEAYSNFGSLFSFDRSAIEEAREQIRAFYAEQGLEGKDLDKAVKKAERSAKGQAVFDKLADWSKQLESTINDVAHSQTEIDTRLQGSKQRQWWGSYWKAMSQDVVRYVGMSPLIKQADVVTNLKTLVNQGISYNVEQRAFLDTISDKIATTFEATDATLLKLVRIQQQDTTAARLGMESALTAFLNNMYETTEYMQSAAADIRANIYEASALMNAVDATAFEYQVQKWMGSLYSVGFNNTSGLSGALGKLAAGDVSGITDGGYGNLLVMAANKAGLSIADILAKGLDDSETNLLMKAMVEYLSDIYAETKDSKVVQQQFANVYGLTASDLKAAANLARSTRSISNNNLNYSGMIAQLQNMAGSMWARTSMGEMGTNLMDNLKFATAWTMGENPILYTIYSVASMLDSTVGGIALPFINAFGTGVDLNTTVANLMRVGSLAGGLLGGIGTMLSGLGQQGTGAGMLKGFGIGNNITTVSRGNGEGLLTTTLTDTSVSGYMGNEDSDAAKDKTLTDANDDAQEQLASAVDESNETKLSTVDEHIMAIYDLLNNVTTGADKLHVVFDDYSFN